MSFSGIATVVSPAASMFCRSTAFSTGAGPLGEHTPPVQVTLFVAALEITSAALAVSAEATSDAATKNVTATVPDSVQCMLALPPELREAYRNYHRCARKAGLSESAGARAGFRAKKPGFRPRTLRRTRSASGSAR